MRNQEWTTAQDHGFKQSNKVFNWIKTQLVPTTRFQGACIYSCFKGNTSVVIFWINFENSALLSIRHPLQAENVKICNFNIHIRIWSLTFECIVIVNIYSTWFSDGNTILEISRVNNLPKLHYWIILYIFPNKVFSVRQELKLISRINIIPII